MLKESDDLHTKMVENVTYFRDKMIAAGFDIKPTQSDYMRCNVIRCQISQDFAARHVSAWYLRYRIYYPVCLKGRLEFVYNYRQGMSVLIWINVSRRLFKLAGNLPLLNNKLLTPPMRG